MDLSNDKTVFELVTKVTEQKGFVFFQISRLVTLENHCNVLWYTGQSRPK